MQIAEKTILLTGAAGGIGSAIAKQLAGRGARLILADLNATALQALQQQLPGEHLILAEDLSTGAGLDAVYALCAAQANGLDVLINCAGLMDFTFVEQLSASRLQLLMNINVLMPILLTQKLLPLLQRQAGPTSILNLGSTFGSIGYPGFSAYCSSKFALRGFTETLRREMASSNVHVLYVAPRATATALNSDVINQMNKALKNSMDSPDTVAQAVLKAIEKGRATTFVGWPEKLFVKINGLLPKLVDNALRKQLPTIRHFCQK